LDAIYRYQNKNSEYLQRSIGTFHPTSLQNHPNCAAGIGSIFRPPPRKA
jgi:hypothetical protein